MERTGEDVPVQGEYESIVSEALNGEADVGRKSLKRKYTPFVPRKGPNTVSGIFLKSVYFLNSESTKFIATGVFNDYNCNVGVLIKGGRGFCYWTGEAFNQLKAYANQITTAIESQANQTFSIDSGESIVVKKVFGRWYTVLCDGKGTLVLSEPEWIQFTNSLSCLDRQFTELYLTADVLKEYFNLVLASPDEDFIPAPNGIPAHLVDRFFDEINYFKRWPNGRGSS